MPMVAWCPICPRVYRGTSADAAMGNDGGAGHCRRRGSLFCAG